MKITKSDALAGIKQNLANARATLGNQRRLARDPAVRKTVLTIERIARRSEYSVYASVGYNHIDMYVTVRALDGFKCEKFSAFLFDVMGALPNAKMETRDYAEALNRDYTFIDDQAKVRLSISAYAKSDSQTCRKVQVGVEVREVPKYELVCE